MLTLYGQDTSPETSTAGDQNGEQNRQRDEIPETVIRDIHEMTSPPELPRLSPSRSIPYSDGASSGENFTTVSREFNALVIAGSSMENNNGNSQRNDQLTRIGENHDDDHQEMNRWAIVLDGETPVNNPVTESSSGSQNRVGITGGGIMTTSTTSVQRVKREEVEAKITAWQTAKIAKVNNRFKRQDAVINGWLNEQVHKANSWMKKIERKLEERRAKAMEKTQNEVAKAQRKAEERRATAEGKRGTEVARLLEVANLMRALGRPPAKRSFFKFS